MSFTNKINTGASSYPGLLKASFKTETSTTESLLDKPKTTFDYFGEEFNKNLNKIGVHLPGSKLAEAAGSAITSITQSEENEIAQEQLMDLEGRVLSSMQDAREKGDEKRYDRLKNLMSDVGNPEIDNTFDAIVKDAPTNTQILASSGELALTAALGFQKGLTATGKLVGGTAIKGLQAAKRAQRVEQLANASGLKKFAVKTGLPLLRESLIGAGFGSTIKASRDEDASVSDIVKAGEAGLLLGGGIFAGVSGLGKGAGFLGPKVGGFIRKGVRKAEEVVQQKRDRLRQVTGLTEVDKTLSTINDKSRGVKEFAADALVKGAQQARQFKAKFIDRFSPLKRIEDLLIDTKNAPLSEKEKVYRDSRLLQSTSDFAAEERSAEFLDRLRPYNDIMPKVKAYLTQLDYIDRANLGLNTPKGGDIKKLKQGLKKIIEEIGPNDMKRVGEAREVVRDITRRELDDYVNAGLISSRERQDMLRAHPNYLPHSRISQQTKDRGFALSGSFNLAKTDLERAVGFTDNIDDPIVAITQRQVFKQRMVNKNKLLNNLVETQEETNIIPGMRKLKSGEKPQGDFDTINLFRKGIQEKWQVPQDIAVAIKNTDAPKMGKGWKLFATPAELLRKGATKYNLSFAIPNKFRDKQTAALTAEAFIDDIAKRYGLTGAKSNNLTNKELNRLYKESGGLTASVFSEGDDALVAQLENRGIVSKAYKKAEDNTFGYLEQINNQFEKSSRIETFKMALNSGLNPKDAALVARDATIDFAKMGSWMRNINAVVPFLNARVQGFVNLPRAAIKNPEVFARTQLYTGVYPSLGLHAHNRRFESFGNINNAIKNKYWVIMTGETKTRDAYDGKPTTVPHFITIPKGEGQTLVSSPIQWWLEKQDKRDFRKTTEMLVDTLGAASPLSFQTFSEANIWGSLTSQLGPGLSVPVGLAGNKHPYFGTPIVPDSRLDLKTELQFKRNTPEVTKELANLIGVAPAQLEFTLNSFGGLPKDLQDTADLAYGLIKNQDLSENLRDKSLSGTDFGIMSEFPISRRFAREASEFYSPAMENERKRLDKIQKRVFSTEQEFKDRAKEIFRKMNKKDTQEGKIEYLSSLGDEMDDKMKVEIYRLKTEAKSVDALTDETRTDIRARYIYSKLYDMKRNGVDKEGQIGYLRKLEKEGLLTEKTKRYLQAIKSIYNRGFFTD